MLTIKQKALKYLTLLLFASLVFTSCKRKGIVAHNGAKDLISFKSIEGIKYTEVARRLQNGLSFNDYGYQLEPEWKLSFISDDSTRIYSPIKKQLINFPLSRGYDSIFNTARTWLKVKKMNKDSLVLEILKSNNDSVDVSGAKVYMILYADNYIKNTLHTTEAVVRHPSRRDTAYVKELVTKANTDYTKAFSARQPVQLISQSPLVFAKQRKTKPTLENHFDTSDDYLAPTFDIVINKAYRDFYYSFTVYVDNMGAMHYGKPLVPFTDSGFEKTFIKESEAIMNSYLMYYFKVIPGSTLGMPHASTISLHVKGRTAAPDPHADTATVYTNY
ncbi:hypothetical protein [Mucilaginibacter agri]|uniref:Uncharacterized protein n=1 Tax=Mucilaginibacter agri TaxID=2695265 RepID=A0A966DVY9_9SPHI|nr:hypothetical protein [Mucilaginibacter agri]NCD71947.1 hypothetical protein [Mucilaginibacter agri]